MSFLKAALLATAITATLSQTASAVMLTTEANSDEGISPFGPPPETSTYGQVFTAPVTGTLDSFEFTLLDGINGSFFAGIGTWNGTADFNVGGGVGSVLFTSPDIPSYMGPNIYNVPTNVSVTVGQLYVAYISVYGYSAAELAAMTPTSMMAATDDSVEGINYFVYHNTSDDQVQGAPSNPIWNYSADLGDAVFTANFSPSVSPVPVPAALPLVLTGLGALGALRKRAKVIYSKG